MTANIAQLGRNMFSDTNGINMESSGMEQFAEDELKDIQPLLDNIANRQATGKLTEENAKALVLAQLKSKEIVLYAVEGLVSKATSFVVNKTHFFTRNRGNSQIS